MKILPQIITSRTNNTIKWLASLSDKKGRAKSKSFIAEGEKLVLEAAAAGLPVTHIVVARTRCQRIMPLIEKAYAADIYSELEVVVVEDDAFSKISTEMSPQGVICVIKYLDFFESRDIIYKEDFCFSENGRAIVLLSMRDPSNVGAVIRSAAAFGVKHIIMSSDCADVYNPKVVRSAMGALFKVKITEISSVESFIHAWHECGRRLFAAELSDGARPLSEISLLKSDAFIIGNEGHGIPAEVSALCDASVYIPISSDTESLNASVAASILMWEQSGAEL